MSEPHPEFPDDPNIHPLPPEPRITAAERRENELWLLDEAQPAWEPGPPSRLDADFLRSPPPPREAFDLIIDALCERVYPDEGWGTNERTFHDDLRALSGVRLIDERDQLRFRFYIDRRPSAWLRERSQAIQLEIQRRARRAAGSAEQEH